uniref:Uncharacterized protein n=2 Tax=Parascaris univalens TaxID=6257 RepID=A0A914ZID3_PARUN
VKLGAMGRLVGLAWAPTLLVGVLEASVVCNGEDGVCEGLVEAFLTNGSNKSEEFDLGCATTEAVPFCWWAIEIGQIKWMLYTNGMSELVERNIRPFCEKVDEFYGFSFTNKTIGFSYIDQKQLRSEKIIETRQILVDVFYFCCSRKVNCTAFSESASEIKVINALANKMLSYIIRASGFSGDRKEFCFGEEGTEMVALPGVDVCIFVADSTTKMKIYNGPMMFNRFDVLSQVARSHNHSLTMLALEERLCLSAKPVDNNYTTHLKDGECLRYSSADGYFLYCCCYVRRELCAYAIDEYALENNSKHTRRIWRRSAQLKKIHDVSLKSGELVTGRSWAYRDFIFSKPANRRKGRTASENNISLWHCAEGEIVLKKNGKGHHSNDLEKVNRTDLPSRSPACYFDVSIGFKSKGYGRDAQNVSIIYGHSEETCGKMSCRMSEPECVNDLLDLSRELITTTVHCCCATHNLCNRGDYDLNFQLGVIARIDFTKGCVGGIYKYFIKAVVIGGSFSDTVYCIHYIDFSTRKERYMVDGETSYIPVGKGMLFALQNLNWTDELQFKNLVLLLLPQPGCGGFHHQQLMQFGIVFCAATMLKSIIDVCS